jgi:DNA-binding HxlR family transcriptional regulator
MLVVRELLLGPTRFTDLRSGLPRVSPDVLAQRLRELEEHGVVRRDELPPPAASRVYELTERGRELEPVILALGRWGSREPANDGPLGPDAAVIALMTMFSGGPRRPPRRRPRGGDRPGRGDRDLAGRARLRPLARGRRAAAHRHGRRPPVPPRLHSSSAARR